VTVGEFTLSKGTIAMKKGNGLKKRHIMKTTFLFRNKRVRTCKPFRRMKNGLFFFAVIAIWSLVLTAPAIGRGDGAGDKDTFSLTGDRSAELFPMGRLFDTYIADPVRPGFSMSRLFILDSEVPNAGKSRYSFMLGGQYGLLKLRPSEFSDVTFQVDIYGAFLGQFDRDNSFDNMGWDGYFGYMLTADNGAGLSFKLAMQHDSSHVGDEYAERTGRRRINYTREETVFGTSYRFPEYIRVYGEVGYGQDLRNQELQAPWRVRGGMEFEDRDRFFKGRLGYYTALDLNFYEESDWKADITVQAGIVMPVRGDSMKVRFGPVYRKGRSLIGEFFQSREAWWGFGLWFDI
jgi:hypothetical protein